jgi:cob(I)alamin adenosyltransferase
MTRPGDTGETRLIDGQRVSKDSPRICAGGAVDELNSVIGLARSYSADETPPASKRIDTILARIQHDLFDLGADLTPLPPRIGRRQLAALDKLVATLTAELPPLRKFILPAGSKTAATLHLARATCRRAERACVRLMREEEISAGILPYLNRLGNVLFLLARLANQQRGVKEQYWQK